MINNIGIIGAGSVGSTLISYLFPAYKENFFLIATGDRANHISEKGLFVNDQILKPAIYSDASQGIKLDLIIISVKNYSLDSAINDLRPLIQEETIILPLQNGIMATKRLQAAFPKNRVLYGIMLRTDAHRTGHRVIFSTSGEIQIGYADNTIIAPEVNDVCECLKKSGLNVKIYEDMLKTQWRKWMLNTSAGQVAVEIGIECGYFGQIDEVTELMRRCMDEILLIAKAENINVTEKDRDEIIELLINYPAHKKMSMLQDVEAGRPIEIEDYAGTVMKLGKKHGIPTPVNDLFYLTITSREKVRALGKHI